MRGDDNQQEGMFSYHSPEKRVPADHPLRPIRRIVDEILKEMSPQFAQLYSDLGRPSIAPERLLRSLLLQIFYSVRSERMLIEQLQYNLLFRWFVGMEMDEAVWNHAVYSKNRERLLQEEVAEAFFQRVLARARPFRSDEHFTVDGTLMEAWASHKSFRPKDGTGQPPDREETSILKGRSKRRIRRSQHSHIFRDRRGQIVDAVSIRERPAESRDRAIPGHWEGDLISGSKNSHLVTLVERHSRFTALVKVPSKDTAVVVAALTRHVRKSPTALQRSLTWARGLEMAKRKTFTVATNVKVYFCDPQSPWQRGSNENTNGLLRQYFPRGTELSGYSQAELDKVALRLNQRPRKTLGFQTPASKLRASVSSTH